ncbi:polysaccharide deacetylase family protein [Chitinibacter sp. SCUT-21]|uniref:polysaccharide deacetylase family protein n=1 Tax=Chitinibacter sp. SCUT-21 TaxID=2970891 RepID=UPI0035A6251F
MRLSSGLILASLMFSHLALAQTPARLRTPVVENQGQVSAAVLERQAKQFPTTFYLEGAGDKKEIAFTFDDGPSEHTAALLDVLKQENVKATFFWQGQNVLKYPEVVKRALAEGHVLANHSFSHPNLSKMEEGEFWWDLQLKKTQQAFQQVVGFQPTMMRPPYGFLNDSQIKKLQAQGMAAILWSVDSADWFHTWKNSVDEVASAKIAGVVQQYIHPEAIVLMHDDGGRSRKPTISAVKAMIPALREQGYRFVTVDQLLKLNPKLKVAVAEPITPTLNELLPLFFKLHNTAQVDSWASVLEDDFVLASASEQMRGIKAYSDYMAQLHAQFPGMKLEQVGAANQINQAGLFAWQLLDAQGGLIAKGVNSVELSAAGKLKSANVYMQRELR